MHPVMEKIRNGIGLKLRIDDRKWLCLTQIVYCAIINIRIH